MQISDAQLKFGGAFRERAKTDLVVLHHAAATTCSVEDIHRWHLANGWLGVGYHYVIRKDGSIWRGRPEGVVGAHAEGSNDRSIGICAEGDFTKEAMSAPQKGSFVSLVRDILARYESVSIQRHCDVNNTTCPGAHFPFDEIVALATGTPIIGRPRATVEQAQSWARRHGGTDQFIALAPLFWSYAPHHGQVDPAGAYAQAAKETAFGRYGGVVDPAWCNTGGFKTAQGGGDGDPAAHQRFSSWLDGVTAHLDHLALYAGADGYPRIPTTDPRHFAYLAGAARTFEALGGRWAPSQQYGHAIVDYLTELQHEPQVQVDEVAALAAEIAALRDQVRDLEAALATRLQVIAQIQALVAVL